ncbi:MAG: hypothetical protein ACRC85_12720 [Kluyvera ascorbata]
MLISESAWEEMTCLFAPSLGYLKPIASLSNFEIQDKKYYLTGDAYISGVPCPDYDDLSIELVLRTGNEKFNLLLAKSGRSLDYPHQSRYSTISYKRGVYCTPKHEGFFIDDLPFGNWQVFIKINARGIIKETELYSNDSFKVEGDGLIKKLSLNCVDSKVFFFS